MVQLYIIDLKVLSLVDLYFGVILMVAVCTPCFTPLNIQHEAIYLAQMGLFGSLVKLFGAQRHLSVVRHGDNVTFYKVSNRGTSSKTEAKSKAREIT